ncbi:unnamed protein product [Ixodes persulcatus]
MGHAVSGVCKRCEPTKLFECMSAKVIMSVNELLRCWLYLRSDCDEDPHDEDPHDCRLLKIAFRNDCSAEDCTAYEQWGSSAVIFFSFLRVDM